ncbi:MAG: 2-hydroxyacyl-CoA dehydratase [bacterium]|nr:2-hydroxyacyl-CoA dehydratase [bacterium]
MSDDKPVIKKIRSTGAMRALMAAYFSELNEAAKTDSAKVAWCTSVGPAELLRSFGFQVYFPENHGALLGSSRMAADLIPAATAAGYSPEICSYLTSDVGAYLNKTTPLSRAFGIEAVPKPDVLVYNTNQCRDVQDWLAFYQREFDVPLIGIETPRSISHLSREMIDGLIAQYTALTPTLQEISGTSFDLDRLKKVMASSYRCTMQWKKVLRIAEKQPSPITFFDGTIHMGPAVVLRGDERAERYYETLLTELNERVNSGVGAVDDEAHRLYWEGMPVWGKLRDNAEQFAANKACVVASTYCNSWIFEDLANDNPFEGMARAYSALFIVRSEEYKERYITAMAADYDIDGFIYHNAKTCPNNSNCNYGMHRRLTDKLGIPHVVIDGDLNDLRLYSEEQARTQFEALIEQLEDSAA